MPTAAIITIGDELLIGQVIDTNSAFIAQAFNAIGLQVQSRIAVGDVYQQIWDTLTDTLAKNDIVILTGGLGPTADDITKPLLCKYFDGTLVTHEPSKQNVIDIFTKLNRPIIARNLQQAEVPSTCTALLNKRGTAPGMWFEKDGKIIISLPGVPHEMKGFITEDIVPLLLQKFTFNAVEHRTLLTAGVGESFLAETLIDFEASLPSFIKMAYLPNYGMVRLRLTGVHANKTILTDTLNQSFLQLQQVVAPHLVTTKDEPMETVVANLLLQNNQTVATAESCTGGYMAQLLTAKSGSSAYFKGAVVAYDNQVKIDVLQVPVQDIIDHGAVSETVAIQMAQNALTQLKTDYAVSVTGVMGPNGGTPQKPVGHVWCAVCNKNKVATQLFTFSFDRQRNIQLTATFAFNFLRKFMLQNN
jgi:nicotinamide-nucleotide amidase